MNRKIGAGVHERCRKIGQITFVSHAGFSKSIKGVIGIANTIDFEVLVGESTSRIEQELSNLSGALSVSPVSYPNYVRVFCCLYRPENRGVGCFVQRPYFVDVKTLAINSPETLSKSKYSVEASETKHLDLFRRR